MRSLHVFAVSAIPLAVFALFTAGAQPTRQLPAATAFVADQFQFIRAVRELSDGRVLVTDGRENRIVVADLSSGTVVPAARTGQGPAEYSRAGVLFGVSVDTTIMSDVISARWLVLQGDSAVATWNRSRPEVAAVWDATQGTMVGVSGSSVAIDLPLPRREGTHEVGPRDSTALVLFSRTLARFDTVARLRAAPMRKTVNTDGNGRILRIAEEYPPWTVAEQAVLCSDGWLALVRLDPFRVEWRDPAGAWIRGRPISYQRVAVNAAEKRAFVEQLVEGTGRAPGNPDGYYAWPAEIPPTADSAPICGPAGHLFIKRNYSSTQRDQLYDVVDRSGNLTSRLVMPRGNTIAGAGLNNIYVVSTDADGVQTLGRVPFR